MHAPIVSIVIPVFNQIGFTRKCLDVLDANTPPSLSYESIVVDNASTDETSEIVLLQYAANSIANVRVIRNATNLGFSKACNQGVNGARGRYVVLLNNDTEVCPNWLAPMIDILDRDARVGAVGGLMMNYDGTIQAGGFFLADSQKTKNPLTIWQYGSPMRALPPANRTEPFLSQMLMGACLAMRASDYLTAGGMDEEYYNGYEDLDLCLRMAERGFLLITQPQTVVRHYGGHRDPKANPERFVRYHANRQRFFDRWLGKVRPWSVQGEDGILRFAFPGLPRNYKAPTMLEPPNS